MSSKPKKTVIKLINSLYEDGHIIKINTARYMGRNKDNIKKSNKQGFKKTIKQLSSWGLKFHKLAISKLSADIYLQSYLQEKLREQRTQLKRSSARGHRADPVVPPRSDRHRAYYYMFCSCGHPVCGT